MIVHLQCIIEERIEREHPYGAFLEARKNDHRPSFLRQLPHFNEAILASYIKEYHNVTLAEYDLLLSTILTYFCHFKGIITNSSISAG